MYSKESQVHEGCDPKSNDFQMAKSTFPPLQSAKMSHTEQLKCCYTVFNNTHHTLPLAFEMPTLVCPRAIVAPLVVTKLKLPA
jgi:hypothetical protein